MTKILIGTLSLALVGVGGLVAAVDGLGEDRPVRSVSIPAGTTTGTTTAGTAGVDDVSGHCDELEHASDRRCAAGATTSGGDDDRPARAGTTTSEADDVSGPCDEPEHADDPRCTGVGTSTTDDEDRSGSGSDSDDRDDNSGSGSGSDDD